MNLSHLNSFYQVALQSSFSKAAEQLGVSKGLVSRHIKALEIDLQCTLLHRTTRSVTLSEAGKDLFDAAENIQSVALQASKSIRNFSQLDRGYIRFTVPSSLGCLLCKEVLPEFIASSPDVKLELDFTTQLKDVEFGEFDVALRAHTQLPDNLIAKEFGKMINVLVASKQWLIAHPIESVNELKNIDCLQHNLNTQWNTWNLRSNQGEKYTIQSAGRISCSSYTGLIEMALSGLGPACLPLPIVENLIAEEKLVKVLPNWFVMTHHFYLLYSKQRTYPRKLIVFIELLMQWKLRHQNWFI